MVHNIAALGGDGIGPEVVREGLKVLAAVAETAGFEYQVEEYPYGTDHYLETGVILPDGMMDTFRKDFEAILLARSATPAWRWG